MLTHRLEDILINSCRIAASMVSLTIIGTCIKPTELSLAYIQSRPFVCTPLDSCRPCDHRQVWGRFLCRGRKELSVFWPDHSYVRDTIKIAMEIFSSGLCVNKHQWNAKNGIFTIFIIPDLPVIAVRLERHPCRVSPLPGCQERDRERLAPLGLKGNCETQESCEGHKESLQLNFKSLWTLITQLSSLHKASTHQIKCSLSAGIGEGCRGHPVQSRKEAKYVVLSLDVKLLLIGNFCMHWLSVLRPSSCGGGAEKPEVHYLILRWRNSTMLFKASLCILWNGII